MAVPSSPLTYPPSSSPSNDHQVHKRKDWQEHPYPTKRTLIISNAADQMRSLPSPPRSQAKADGATLPKGPFLDDEDDDEAVVQNGPAIPSLCRLAAPLEILESPPLSSPPEIHSGSHATSARSSKGTRFNLSQKQKQEPLSYEKMSAGRSTIRAGRATKSFYGVDIHDLIEDAARRRSDIKARTPSIPRDPTQPCLPGPSLTKGARKRANMLWTEKYRARKFTDLVGDDRTHREVLRWIKHWDPIVFPGSARQKPKSSIQANDETKPHRKILLLTGAPGLGKTTLAHVCAKQAGYEVLEINASDDRTSQVVKGQIKDSVGTENVKGVNTNSKEGVSRKAGRPVCVIVDEVDGVMTGNSAGGEGGFIKALVDLVALDQKHSQVLAPTSANAIKPRRKGDRFRLLRPLILICNDVYHPSLRSLRTSNTAEIIHIRKAPLDKVINRLHSIFDQEGLPCDGDGVRRLCEATWGVSSRKEGRSQATRDGDLRGCLVMGEWAASKLRASSQHQPRLTRLWVEDNIAESLSHAGGSARGLGRGSTKDVVERVFLDDAGFAKSAFKSPPIDPEQRSEAGTATGVAEAAKASAMHRLREIIGTTGDSDRILADCFGAYASQPFQDDTFLTKPNAACEWLHFHDQLSSRVHVGHEWELGSYLPQSILGFHNLFASPLKQSWHPQKKWDEEPEDLPHPFAGQRAHLAASEASKQNVSILHGLQLSLSITLARSFRATETLSTEFLPHLVKMLTPEVKPVVVGGSREAAGVVSVRKESERQMIERAVEVMHAVGLTFERTRIETGRSGQSNYVYRMEPPLDKLATFERSGQVGQAMAPTRYAVRQAMNQEYQKYAICKNVEARQARYQAGGNDRPENQADITSFKDSADIVLDQSRQKPTMAKRDFFGRSLSRGDLSSNEQGANANEEAPGNDVAKEIRKAWISFHEGFSNAVRKPVTLHELMRDFECR